MKDMIAEIVETDKRAREITEQAKVNKLNVQKEVAILSKKIKDEYITRARKRINLNEKAERKIANDIWKSIRAKQLRTLKRLENSYNKNCDNWVNSIVERTIGE